MPSLSISARELLTSGVHYGHKVSRWNPKMRPYIHAKKSLIHIIDVRETIKGLVRAWHLLAPSEPRLHLVLVGNMEPREPVSAWAEPWHVGKAAWQPCKHKTIIVSVV